MYLLSRIQLRVYGLCYEESVNGDASIFVNATSERCEGDYGQPTIWTAAFPNTPRDGFFWSSSPNANVWYGVWSVNFNNGYVGSNSHKYGWRYVRLVRGGQ